MRRMIAGLAVLGVAVALPLVAAEPRAGTVPHPERGAFNTAESIVLPSDVRDDIGPRPAVIIDPGRTLFIHDNAVLSSISFNDILNQLAATAEVTDGPTLFADWFATLAPGSDDLVFEGRACPAEGSTAAVPALNAGFPMLCDPLLAEIAATPDLLTAEPSAFRVIGAVNRFDLRQPGDCGEYRLVAASNPDWPGWERWGGPFRTRLLMNFEARIPDPAGNQSLCAAIQRFFVGLSRPSDEATAIADIRTALRRFFLEGGVLTGEGQLLAAGSSAPGLTFVLRPALSAQNLGADPAHVRGQVRTNTLTNGLWVLRQFEFGAGGDITRLGVVPVAGSPDVSLFAAGNPAANDLAPVIAVGTALLDPDLNRFHLDTPAHLNASQMVLDKDFPEDAAYQAAMPPPWPHEPLPDAFVALAGNVFMPRELVVRLEVLSCAGCHGSVGPQSASFRSINGIPTVWPGRTDFVHVNEHIDPDGTYPLSSALTQQFLPHRERLLRTYLNLGPAP